VLDSLITLQPVARTLEETVCLICSRAASTLNSKCLSAGFVDAELEHTVVTVGSEAPTIARFLLARALDEAPHRKVWVLTYDPDDKTFVLGIQPAVLDGIVGVQPIPQLSLPSLSGQR